MSFIFYHRHGTCENLCLDHGVPLLCLLYQLTHFVLFICGPEHWQRVSITIVAICD